jgi:uncharacterized protein (TIGR02453 family)
LTRATVTSAFPPGVDRFFAGLRANNNREYFIAHRPEYEALIREPLERLAEVAQSRYGPAKEMRPNRDVRFSADKTPYRLGASMWAGEIGGVYLTVNQHGIETGGGLYEPTRDQLARARESIASHPIAGSELDAIIAALRAAGYEIAGPALVTAPKGYDREHPRIELLRLKHYAATKPLPLTATEEDILATWAEVHDLIAWAGEQVGAALAWP